jgi:hypothetical protein
MVSQCQIAMQKSKFFALLHNFWNKRSNLKDLEARFSEERLCQRITEIANRSIKIKDFEEFDRVLLICEGKYSLDRSSIQRWVVF